MADGADGGVATRKPRDEEGGKSPAAPLGDLATLPADQLPPGMPPEIFTAPGMLALADLLPIMTCYVDSDEIVRFLNKPLADFLEEPREAILGKSVREMMGEETYSHRKQLIADALAGQRQFFVAEFEHPRRGKVAIQAEYVPWTGKDGAVSGLVMLVSDISEQATAERALKESEARFKRIANSAPVMMWVTRLDRVRDFVNDAYVEFTGLSHDEARTLDWRKRIHPEDASSIMAQSVAGEASLLPFTLEGRYLRADGVYRWLRSVSQPRFGPDGELSG